jgi:hypothetical protein
VNSAYPPHGRTAGTAANPPLGHDFPSWGGGITEIPSSDRGAPVPFSGELDTGDMANSDEWLRSLNAITNPSILDAPGRVTQLALAAQISPSAPFMLVVTFAASLRPKAAPRMARHMGSLAGRSRVHCCRCEQRHWSPRALTLADDRVNTRCGEYRLGLGENVGTFDPPATASTRRALIYERWDTHGLSILQR